MITSEKLERRRAWLRRVDTWLLQCLGPDDRANNRLACAFGAFIGALLLWLSTGAL